MAGCPSFAHRPEWTSVWEGTTVEGRPGRRGPQNAYSIFSRKIPVRGLTRPANQQTELDRPLAQLQELSKHVTLQQIFHLKGPPAGWVGRERSRPGLSRSRCTTSGYSDVAARELLSPAEGLATDVMYLPSFSLQKSAAPSGNLHLGCLKVT